MEKKTNKQKLHLIAEEIRYLSKHISGQTCRWIPVHQIRKGNRDNIEMLINSATRVFFSFKTIPEIRIPHVRQI